MSVLHLLASGGTGGIESLVKDYGVYSQNDNYFLFLWNGGITAEEMKAAGMQVLVLEASKKDLIGPWNRICALCKEHNIHTVVVHHASPVAHLYLLLLKKKFPGIQTVAYAHGCAEDMRGGAKKRGLKLRRFLIRQSLKKADRVIAISHAVRKSLIRYYGIPEESIVVIYNGTDCQKIKADFHPGHSPIQIVYVGRLIEQKGVQILLQALGQLADMSGWHLNIIGDGPYRGQLETLVRQMNLTDRVAFHGICRDVPQRLAAADLFVHSPIWEEGFGITIIEAMAAGLLCICAQSGAIPEIIDSGVDGYLVEKGNVQELADKLRFCIENYDTENTVAMRQAAVKKARHFSIEMFVQQLDGVLKGNSED